MDREILEILKSMQNDMKTMQNDISSMRNNLDEVNNRLGTVEHKTDKNTMLLENLNKNVEVVAEVQTSFSEKLDRERSIQEEGLHDRLDVIELAVTDTSSRVKEVQKELARVVRNTAENWAEIVELKVIK